MGNPRLHVLVSTWALLTFACGGAAKPRSEATRQTTTTTTGAMAAPVLASPVTGDLPRSMIIEGVLPRANAASNTPASCRSFTLTAALFEENGTDVLPSAARTLDTLAYALLAQRGAIVLTGHTDPRPTAFPGGNSRLSFLRALAVRDALVARDVPLSRFRPVEGRAARELVDLGTDEEALRRNRRVEAIVEC